jgi:hypothetical protein
MTVQFLYQDYSMKDRERLLSNMAAKKENRSYSRSLTQEEIDREKDQYASRAIELEDAIETAKAEAKSAKAQIEALKKIMEEKINKIRNGKEEAVGVLYGIPDQHNGKMLFYDKYGELINTRDLTPDERQGRLFIDNESSQGAAGNVTIPVENHDALAAEVIETVEGAASIEVQDVEFEEGHVFHQAEVLEQEYSETDFQIPIEEVSVEEKPKKRKSRKKSEAQADEEDSPTSSYEGEELPTEDENQL